VCPIRVGESIEFQNLKADRFIKFAINVTLFCDIGSFFEQQTTQIGVVFILIARSALDNKRGRVTATGSLTRLNDF
jgi:hypothetical protein